MVKHYPFSQIHISVRILGLKHEQLSVIVWTNAWEKFIHMLELGLLPGRFSQYFDFVLVHLVHTQDRKNVDKCPSVDIRVKH